MVRTSLVKELTATDHLAFKNFVRMDLSAFEDLLSYIGLNLPTDVNTLQRNGGDNDVNANTWITVDFIY